MIVRKIINWSKTLNVEKIFCLNVFPQAQSTCFIDGFVWGFCQKIDIFFYGI